MTVISQEKHSCSAAVIDLQQHLHEVQVRQDFGQDGSEARVVLNRSGPAVQQLAFSGISVRLSDPGDSELRGGGDDAPDHPGGTIAVAAIRSAFPLSHMSVSAGT